MTLRGRSGYEAQTRDPERRAFFDITKRISELESITGGGPWDFIGTIPGAGPPTTTPPAPHEDGDMVIDSGGIGWVWNGSAWINVGSIRGPAGATGPPGPAGPTGATGPQGPPGTGGGTGTGVDEVWIGPDDPIALHPTIELWVDSDASGGGSGGGGSTGTISYVHHQDTVAASWIVSHMLGWFPNVTVIDSGGATCEGDIAHIDDNTLTIQFSGGGFTGVAFLS